MLWCESGDEPHFGDPAEEMDTGTEEEEGELEEEEDEEEKRERG